MKKESIRISDVIMDVADSLFTFGPDHSPTTIRTMINDILDSYEKEGFAVNHGYNQSNAVKGVQKRTSMLEKSSQGVD